MPKKVRLGHALARYADSTTRLKNTITSSYHQVQRSEGLLGTHKTYEKLIENSPDQPSKSTLLQVRAYDVAAGFVRDMGELIDNTATKDYANAQVTADVEIDGKVLLKAAPPTLLLSLQNQLTDLRTFLLKLPVLSADEEWTYDANQKCRVSKPSKSTRVEQVKEPVVLYDATDRHPAQTALVENPKTVGTWTTMKYSGAVTLEDKDTMISRVNAALDAVKQALHEANSFITDERHPAKDLLGYVTHGILS